MKTIIYILVTISLYCCLSIFQKKKRPNTVPSSCEWYGGPDGGNWIGYKYDYNNALLNTEIYSDEGAFELNATFIIKDTLEIGTTNINIQGFDGIFLIVRGKNKSKFYSLEQKNYIGKKRPLN